MAQAYNHTSAEAMTYQRKPPTTTPYQQVGSGSQIQLNEKTSTFQTAAVPPPALLNTLPSQQTYQSQGKRKDFHPHQSHFSKMSKGDYRDNQGYHHDNPRPQAVNTMGQARVRIAPTPRAMKNSERALRFGHQVFHVEDIRGGKYQKPNWDPICFYPEEERGIIYPHNDPLIVEAHIANFEVR
ncbi:hypothetical protein FF1_038313 [Malus domestica]